MNNIMKIIAILVIPAMLFGCGKGEDLEKADERIAKAAEAFVEKSINEFVNDVELEGDCIKTTLVGKTVRYCDERLGNVDKLVKEGFEILEIVE